MENKSDDRRGVQTLLGRGVGRLSFLLVSDHKMSNKKKMKKKARFLWKSMNLLNRENNAHNHHRLIKVDDKK